MAELKLTELGGQIRLRGHWEISIRPKSYEENRLEYGDIYPAVVSGYTRHQHWDFPSIAGEADANLGARGRVRNTNQIMPKRGACTRVVNLLVSWGFKMT